VSRQTPARKEIKMKKTLVLLSCLLASVPQAFSAEQIARKTAPQSEAHLEWKRLAGRVEATDLRNRSLRVRDRNGNLARITVDDKVQIFRHWRLVALNDVQIKDHVILKRSVDGLQ
jgi:hypothetical protein